MIEPFLLRALLAGLILAVAAGPLGCFVVWRRMAYFGDATAHGALLGVALSLSWSLPLLPAVAATALILSLLATQLSGRGYAMDTLLGVLAHSALAFSLIAISFLPSVRIDLNSYLFGDILAVSWDDLALMALGAAAITALIATRWTSLLLATLNLDLARAQRINPRREEVLLTLALAVLVAVAIKIVGALLITAMLIIPAAAARSFARTPESMALLAIALAALSASTGLAASWYADTPAGPSMVAAAAVIFLFSASFSRRI
ncbi:metal ABC transporter permease [Paracoccaceae bacterium GXU_MW_L88]